MKLRPKRTQPKRRPATGAKTDRVSRKRATHYRSLLNMLNGFAYCRMHYVDGRPHDFTYLEVNQAFEDLTGLRNVVGRNVAAVIPGFREQDPEVLAIYGRVAFTGVPERFETYVKSLGKWFAVSVSSPRKGYFVAVFDIVTARKEAEEALQRSEQQYRQLFDSMLSGLIVCDVICDASGRPSDHRLVRANPAFETLTGLSLQDQLGKTAKDLAFGWPEEVQQRLYQIALTGTPVEYERFNETLGRFYEVRAFAPQPGQFALAFADITQRKLAEAKAGESEAKLRALFEGSAYAIGLANDGVTLMVNPAYVELFGYAQPSDVIGKSILDDIAPEERARLREFTQQRSMAKTVPASYDTRGLKRDGTVFDMAVRVSTYELNGEVYTIGILRDITVQKQAEVALRMSEERFSKAFHLSLLSIAISTLADGVYREVNDSFLRTTGYPREEVIGRTSAELDLWVDERHRQEIRGELVAGNAVREVPAVLRGRGGALHDVLYSAVTIKLGGVDHVLSLVLDITERKRAEVALRASQEQLRALAARIEHIREEERAGLARELHDELGQGLTALQIDLAGLDARLRTAGPDDLPGLRDKIAGMVPRAERLIETTQTISANMRPGVLDDLGLVAAVEWLAADFEHRTGLTCVARLPAADLTLDLGLAVAMFRIVQEALTNVIRHAKASRVEVRLQATAGELRLDILDDGCGITSSQIEDGRSLGLFSMRERAAEFGGTVAFRGEDGRGTTVSVRMPRNRPTPETGASHENPHR